MTTKYEIDLQNELGIDDTYEKLDNDAKAKHLGQKFGFLSKQTAENILKMSWIIHKASKSSDLWPKVKGECQLNLPSDESKIKKLLVIGSAYESLMKYAEHLPPHWSVLYEIARFSDDTLDQLVQRGFLYKGATLKIIELGLINKKKGAAKKLRSVGKGTYKSGDLYIPIKVNKKATTDDIKEISALLGYLANRGYITYDSYVEFDYLPHSIDVFESIVEKLKLQQAAPAPKVCTTTLKRKVDTKVTLHLHPGPYVGISSAGIRFPSSSASLESFLS